MKNPILMGAISSAISALLWAMILLSTVTGEDTSLAAVGLYLIWLVFGIPIALLFSFWSLFLTYVRPKANTHSEPKRSTWAMIISGSSFLLIVIPVLTSIFV